MTYSIIGFDTEAGEIGIGVQSRWFHAGQDVAWIKPGVGAVCTQAFTEPSYGPGALELLRAGRAPEDALAELTGDDPGRDVRQVAIADLAGRFAQHTGSRCVAAAGHVVGTNCCAQGNMLASDGCWGAMVETFETSRGSLAERLIDALDAAESEGGDARGRQAARLLVRRAQPTGAPWSDRIVDLSVVDHPQPLVELRRLFELRGAYDRLSHALELAGTGDLGAAVAEIEAATALAPDDDQIAFWRSTMLGGAGRPSDAVAASQQAVRAHPGWTDYLRSCVEAGLVPPQALALAQAPTI
jgi:uncharacterized Ntn-hydrolase superfamily protein